MSSSIKDVSKSRNRDFSSRKSGEGGTHDDSTDLNERAVYLYSRRNVQAFLKFQAFLRNGRCMQSLMLFISKAGKLIRWYVKFVQRDTWGESGRIA